jgi:hypothetical protein
MVLQDSSNQKSPNRGAAATLSEIPLLYPSSMGYD